MSPDEINPRIAPILSEFGLYFSIIIRIFPPIQGRKKRLADDPDIGDFFVNKDKNNYPSLSAEIV